MHAGSCYEKVEYRARQLRLCAEVLPSADRTRARLEASKSSALHKIVQIVDGTINPCKQCVRYYLLGNKDEEFVEVDLARAILIDFSEHFLDLFLGHFDAERVEEFYVWVVLGAKGQVRAGGREDARSQRACDVSE